MKIVSLVLLLAAAGLGYGAWTFRQQALDTDGRLSEALAERDRVRSDLETATAASERDAASARSRISELEGQVQTQTALAAKLGVELDKMRAAAKSEAAQGETRLETLQAELDELRAKLATATSAEAEQRERLKTLRVILASYYALDLVLDSKLNPCHRAALLRQQEFANDPNDQRFGEFKESMERLQEAAREAILAAAQLRTLLSQGKATLAEFQFPSEGLSGILERGTRAWGSVGSAAANTAKSARRHARAILSNEDWQGLGVTVEAGEIVVVTATGRWRWGASMGGAVGPEGENQTPRYRILPEAGNGALIARIRGSDRVHRGVPAIRPDRAGELEFRINDELVGDNKGALDVTAWTFVPFRPE